VEEVEAYRRLTPRFHQNKPPPTNTNASTQIKGNRIIPIYHRNNFFFKKVKQEGSRFNVMREPLGFKSLAQPLLKRIRKGLRKELRLRK
jgi:hypothetical protein